MSPEISVIVPTYNTARVLRRCLEALFDQTLPHDRYEVVVADDGSTDETSAVLEEMAARGPLVAVRLARNAGRSAARNAAAAAASAPVLAFTDSDVLVARRFVEAHLAVHTAHERAVGRGPVVLTHDLEHPFDSSGTPVDFSAAFLDTANASMRTAHLQQAGGFDETFRTYGWEDFDLGMRLQRLGLRRVQVKQALAYHYRPPLSDDDLPALLAKERERALTAVQFYRKHPGLQGRILIGDNPAYRTLVWITTLGGRLREENAVEVIRAFRERGRRTLARIALFGVLNRHYLTALDAAKRSHGGLAR